MTYPRTPEEKARQLGARLACDAFNAVGSLDVRKCQEVGDAFAAAIVELVVGPKRLPPDEPLSPEAAAALEAGLEDAHLGRFKVWGDFSQLGIPKDLGTFACVAASPGTPWAPPYMYCHVCGTARDKQVRELCGHDTYNGSERRWYCSRKCFDR